MVKMKKYLDQNACIAGMTLKDLNRKEENNMALHVCKEETAVLENRKALAHSLGVTLDDFVCANQTHSTNFYEVKREDVGKGAYTMDTAISNTDALYTYEPHKIGRASCSERGEI